MRGAIGAAYHVCDPDADDAHVVHVGPMVDIVTPVHTVAGGEASYDTRVAGGSWRLGARVTLGFGRTMLGSVGARAVHGHLTVDLDALYDDATQGGGPLVLSEGSSCSAVRSSSRRWPRPAGEPRAAQ